jgi:hypothetical protein
MQSKQKWGIALALCGALGFVYVMGIYSGHHKLFPYSQLIAMKILVESSLGVALDTKTSSALELLAKNGFDPNSKMSTTELAYRFLYLTYNHCKDSSKPHPDLNELFRSCETQCGGYAYILRGLLESQGIKTRYAHLYNIPQQGNHTAVEYLNEQGLWSFIDPTFGVTFLPGKDISSKQQPVKLRILELHHADKLNDMVVQANRDGMNPFDSNLRDLYNAQYLHSLMNISNYVNSEQISNLLPGENLILTIDIDAKTPTLLGTLESINRDESVAKWLKDTNALLNDNLPDNDVSFVTSEFFGASNRQNIVRIANLDPKEYYILELRVLSRIKGNISVNTIGKELASDKVRHTVETGNNLIRIKFSSSKDTALFSIIFDQKIRAELFGLKLSKYEN